MTTPSQPQRPPLAGVRIADYSMHAAGPFAALCARRYRAVGPRSDVAVRDIATAFVGHALMDMAMNDRDTPRPGNRDDAMAPHGVFLCQGNDAWITIAVDDAADWDTLKEAMGNPRWAAADEYADAFQHWTHQNSLERRIAEWTAAYTADALTERLQDAGIAAFPSLSAAQLLAARTS